MFALLPLAWRLGLVAFAAVAAVSMVSGIYFKIRHDAVVQERAKVEREKQDAIGTANRAKQDLRRLCDLSPDECVRNIDPWFRD